MKKHYPVRNALGGCFCKRCFEWSNMPDGLKDEVCNATKEEMKNNKKTYNEKLKKRDDRAKK